MMTIDGPVHFDVGPVTVRETIFRGPITVNPGVEVTFLGCVFLGGAPDYLEEPECSS